MPGTKLIVDVDDVRERLSLSDIPEINEALGRGLTSAHVFFAAAVGSKFEERVDGVDIFYLDPDLHGFRPNNQFRLRLKQAFVKPGSLVVTYATTRKDVLSTPATLPAADYALDDERGLLYIDDASDDAALSTSSPADNYRNKFVAVKYTAGFGDTSGVKPPEWLREAVLAWMPSALLVKSDDVDKQMKIAVGIRQLAAAMVEPYKRESVFNFLPIY